MEAVDESAVEAQNFTKWTRSTSTGFYQYHVFTSQMMKLFRFILVYIGNDNYS